jgi:hypothetical protein
MNEREMTWKDYMKVLEAAVTIQEENSTQSIFTPRTRSSTCGGKSHEVAAQLTTCVACNDISRRGHHHPPAHPVMAVAQPVSEV